MSSVVFLGPQIHQNRWRLGLRPRSHWGTLQRLQVLYPLAGFKGAYFKAPTSKERGGEGKMEARGGAKMIYAPVARNPRAATALEIQLVRTEPSSHRRQDNTRLCRRCELGLTIVRRSGRGTVHWRPHKIFLHFHQLWTLLSKIRESVALSPLRMFFIKPIYMQISCRHYLKFYFFLISF